MEKIIGRVLVKETSAGIANLVVAAFDYDVPKKDQPVDNNAANVFDINKLGKRIGSVLTDSEGRFILTKVDLNFDGIETRPDLILVIFAPEDIEDKGNYFPLAPEKRLLYVSRAPRTDAGSEEAYVIRLSKEKLESYKIPYGSGSQNDAAINDFVTGIERNYSLQNHLTQKTKVFTQQQLDTESSNRKKAKQKIKKFTSIPLIQRNDSNLLENEKDLVTKQKKIVKEGLKKMNSSHKQFTITLPLDIIKEFGLKEDEDGEFSGNVDTNKFIEQLNEVIGISLLRKDDPKPSTTSAASLFKKFIVDVKKADNPILPG
ncbi:MAG TPA: hypothetical protein VGD22_18325 [Sphingobacteriaceae bacterium]